MPKLKSAKHETFAREVAKGSSLTNAYLKAGYKTDENGAHASSSRLIDIPSVADRVAELQDMASQKTLVTIGRLTDELEEARNLAMRDDKGAAAAVSAVMAKAKLHGLDVNKIEAKINGNIAITISSDDGKL